MEQKINVNQICKIKIFRREVHKHYYYHVKKHFWNKKEGFYYNLVLGPDEYYSEEEINATGNIYVDGRTVYYKPHIEIYLSNGHCVIDWHESTDELDRFVAEYFKSIPLIII